MYRNSYQRGMLTVFFSVGAKPFNIWETHTQDGYITRFLDQDIKSMVVEIGGTNVSTTYMVCPKGNAVLGITMPFLVMIVKNLKKYFSFEVTILDETSTRRRFRVSNFQSTTQILPLCTVMPIGLSDGWNQIQFNLAEFTLRAYKKSFVEVQKIKINANIRLRRIYFTEKLVPEDQLPPEYKLFFPLTSKINKGKKSIETENLADKENIEAGIAELTPLEENIKELKPEEEKTSKIEVVQAISKNSALTLKVSLTKQESTRKVIKEDVIPASEVVDAVEKEPDFEVEEIVKDDAPPESRKPSIVSILKGALSGSNRHSVITDLTIVTETIADDEVLVEQPEPLPMEKYPSATIDVVKIGSSPGPQSATEQEASVENITEPDAPLELTLQ